MALVALLSNPNSTGNRSLLPAVRNYCAKNPDIFHYEVEEIGQIAKALEMIARVKPKVLVINGGDGTVQSALTELYHGGHFEGSPPPVAVLPNGKTNLIALDLGAEGDPLEALARIIDVAKGDLSEHIVVRELIALSDGSEGARPVLGMFFTETCIAPLSATHTIVVLHFYSFRQIKEVLNFTIKVGENLIGNTMIANSYKTDVFVGVSQLIDKVVLL